MRTLRVLLADDEKLARTRLERLVAALPGVEVVAVCATGEDVVELLDEEPVDLLLLDIDMPGLTGMDVAALLPDPAPAVVFCTAHPEHAAKAFRVGAADYLLKPVEAGQLAEAVARVRGLHAAAEQPRERVALPTRKGVRLVQPGSLLCAVFDGTAVWVTLTGESSVERVQADLTLVELEARLPRAGFLRTHRRAIVNLDAVDLLEPQASGGYLACVRGGPKVAVSRAVSRQLRRSLGLR